VIMVLFDRKSALMLSCDTGLSSYFAVFGPSGETALFLDTPL